MLVANPAVTQKGRQSCLGCLERERADVLIYCCKVLLCASSGEYLNSGIRRL